MSRPLPLDLTERVILRRKLLREELLKARHRGQRARLSMKCEWRLNDGTHPATRPGCANDGTGCLCECHDEIPALASSVGSSGDTEREGQQ